MSGLFDLAETRSSKSSDKAVASRSKTRAASSVMTTKGTSILDRIQLITQTVEQKLGQYKDMYGVINVDEILHDYITECIGNGECALDTETTGLNPMLDSIAGACLYTPNQKGVYIPINHESYITGLRLENQLSPEFVASELQRLEDKKVAMIMHNANFDIRTVYWQLGVRLNCYWDTLLASQLLNENEPHGLKVLHQKYVLDGVGDAWSFGKLFDNIPFTKIPIDTAYMYAARDPHITYELYEFQKPYLTKGMQECAEQELEKVSEVFWNIEMPFISVTIDMEDNGIAFDFDYQKELSEKYAVIRDDRENQCYTEINKYADKILAYKQENPMSKLDDPINLASPQQLSIFFYDILGCESVDKKSPRGTGEEVLAKLDAKYHLPICKAILDLRGVEKLINTYIDKLPDCVNPNTNKIHGFFNQMGARTGRMSSENPNMQNIPSHNKDIRKLFVADKGCYILSADFSQQEPKVMTALCQDEGMLEAYRNGEDLYARIASLSFHREYTHCLEHFPKGTPIKKIKGVWEFGTETDYDKLADGEDVYAEGKDYRSRAKSILLGVLYGRGIDSIAEQLNCSSSEADAIKNSVFEGFPAIKQFEEDSITMAEQKGYVTTFWGRKRRLPEMMLPDYQYEYMEGHGDFDPLDFTTTVSNEVPYEKVQKYNRMLQGVTFGRKKKIFEKINAEGVHVIDNTLKVQDATRQCVNSRIQGSAADMTKLAGINLLKNERLRELGFKLLIPVHDEFLAMCPIATAKECVELFSKCMADSAKDLHLPISVDVDVSERWYGEKIEL